jgi:DNA topoisomerase-1
LATIKKTAATQSGKSLVIVESPAKARTIGKFLGKKFTVEASIGHVRDLPQGAKEVPEQFKGEEWAYLGVNINDDFKPVYIVPPGKKQQVIKLRKALKEASGLYLATDEDREGEAISWHLHELLKPKVPVRRLVFHEITREAIEEALQNSREIDLALVQAQETRRILDRLYGYDVSQFLWKKIGPGLSAGRVQSVAVRLIVERERDRIAFVPSTYWDVEGVFATQTGDEFRAELVSVDGRQVPRGKDFDSRTGKLKDPNLLLLDEDDAQALAQRLQSVPFRITKLEIKPFTERPKPPFTTSTLQQEANRKLGFTARRTMKTAQSLYENGHITYMRTDSTTMAKVAKDAARDLVRTEYGPEYLSAEPRVYKSKVKNAQEAHEAIRPAGHPFELPSALQPELTADEYKLFEMIWKRTIASQMADARKRRTTVTVEGGGATFQASGATIEFEGFLRAYVEGSDDPQAALANREILLPKLEQDENLACRQTEAKGHTTQPPARFTEASLTRTLEEKGIGRPSTYASIIETIQARNYVFKKGNALVPSWVAFSVIRLMEEHLPSLVDYEFTAQMEDLLDSISRHEAGHLDYLRQFYFGDGSPGLRETLKRGLQEVDPRVMSRFELGAPASGEYTEPVTLRVGKYGPFLEQGERKASVPIDMPPDELTLAAAMDLLDHAEIGDEPLGLDPESGKPIFLKKGRFGPYIQLGSTEDTEKPRNVSLLKGMNPSETNLELALRLLSLPRNLGEHPESKDPVIASNGRYGPYIQCASETRSLPEGVSPLEVELDEALDLLKQPKTRGRGSATPREPIKEFGKSPVTGEPIKLLAGRYGPYVTDGQTNASLPKDTPPEVTTFELAVRLLEERAAKAPTRRKAIKKKAVKKAARKKATAKKSAKKSS